MHRAQAVSSTMKRGSFALEAYRNGTPEAWRKIVDAAARLFCKRGYSVVTMHDIAGAVGLSKAGLYHHCPSKEQILADIVRLSGAILLQQLGAVRKIDATPGERLRRFVVTRMETIAAHQELFTIVWQERPFIDHASFEGIAKSAQIYRAGVRALIEAAKRSGELKPDVDAHLLMLAIDGMTGWAYTWFRRSGSVQPTRIGERFWSFMAGGVLQAAATAPGKRRKAGPARPRRAAGVD